MRRFLVSLLAGLTFVVAGCAQSNHQQHDSDASLAHSEPPTYHNFTELWRDSDAVVVAIVDKESVKSEPPSGIIMTTSVFRVQKALKGPLQAQTIVPLPFFGGEVDGRKMPHLDPLPQVGTTHLLFLKYRHSTSYPDLKYWLTQGIWSRAEVKPDGRLEVYKSAFNHPLKSYEGKSMIDVEKAAASISNP